MSSKFLFAFLCTASTLVAAQSAPQVIPVPIQSHLPAAEMHPTLKPWPADKKLTIGELSALQEAKERESLLNKFGYTGQQARRAPQTSITPIPARSNSSAVSATRILVTGIYGSAKDPRAEILVDGVVRTVRAGDLFGGVSVASIDRGNVVFRKGARPARSVAVGNQIEL